MSFNNPAEEEIPGLAFELEELMNLNYDLVARQIDDSYPRVDIIEEEELFRISADMPGMSKEDFSVDVENGVLTISGDKKAAVKETLKNRFYHFERKYGEFCRSFNLPANADSESIEAFYKDGVLDIVVKKVKEAKPVNIQII